MIMCLIISSILGALVPIYMNRLTTSYDSTNDFYQVLRVLALIFVATFINRGFYNLVINKYVVELIQSIRSYCYSKWLCSYEVQTSNSNKNDKFPQGEVLARIMTDTESIRELVTSGTFGIFIDIFFVLSSLVSFYTLNKVAGLSLGALEIGCCLLLVWGSKYMREVFLKVRQARGELYRTIADVIGGVRETYYIENKQYSSKKSEVVFDNFLNRILVSNVWDASYYSLAESLYPIFLAFAVFIIPHAGMKEIGLIFALVDLIQRSIGPIKDVSSKVANIQRALSGVVRINEFLAHLDSARSSDIDKEIQEVGLESINIRIDKYSYPRKSDSDTPFSIEDISLDVKIGELIGIVGLSGSGKSTLLNILSANIIPDSGLIKLNKKDEQTSFDFKDFNQFIEYRELVGIVSQDSHIFSESVHFNITMGHDGAGDFDEFWNWVKKQLSYIDIWGITPDTKLSQNDLSLGQKQLLAAIRACYLKKPIVLFDEISSSLDSNLEYALRKMVLLVQKNSMTFIVAHRLETIIEASQIAIMHHGKMVDIGAHSQLMERSKIYREFIDQVSH